MTGKFRKELDIDPEKIDSYVSQDIRGIKDDQYFKPYTRYGYSATSSSFQLNSVSYSKIKFDHFPVIANVERFYTYFNDNKKLPLAFQAYTSDQRYHYYTTGNIINSTKADATFEEFITKEGPGSGRTKEHDKELTYNQTINVLQNIEQNGKLEYSDLVDEIKRNLWRTNDVFFDLSKKPQSGTEKVTKYNSDTTGIEIIVKIATSGGFLKVQHDTKTNNFPFHIKGLKDPDEKIIVMSSGFPNDLLEKFSVYYKMDDKSYKHPFMIILNLSKDKDPRYLESKYIILRNKTNTWSIRRITVNNLDEEKDLTKILKSVDSSGNVDFEKLDSDLKNKLTDVTENLLIDLTKTTEERGTYNSDKKIIPYRKIVSTGYSFISHADTFNGFTVTAIKVTTQHSINSQDLIPKRTDRLDRLKVFYNGSTTKDPSLIYFLYSSGKRNWISRHLGDTTWKEQKDHLPTSDVDSEKIRSLLEKLKIPNVQIDLSKPNTGNSTYQPEDNTLKFKVESKQDPPDSGFWKFMYTMTQNNQPFTVESVKHGKTPLNGISPPDKLLSISVYYLGEDPGDVKKLLLVEVALSGNSKYLYYEKKDENANWTVLSTHEQGTKLEGSLLTQKLNQLKEKQHPKKHETKKEKENKSESQEKKEEELTKETHNGGTSRQDSSGNNSSSSESTVASPQTSSNAGKIAGGVIGALLFIVLTALLVKKVGPAVRAQLESRNPPL
ncbi:hypothetical protein BEWA_047770 [Theileria equi strain WA]|uniref:Uncharacterized protein n=1 Tax=Theileria equi strain WA TaxID=1537102 RepID=L1LA49_THEEQ|nr:hypothetical protein BEWA_047770 [Theileria equi strain WA]EKX72312.1 hypothetical protein BEWA_047770 [Theileria equi strain WA]|eukprot:XP_004831764.1 hypothetical protein BEWA_047770 [Theileria equi strain WA]